MTNEDSGEIRNSTGPVMSAMVHMRLNVCRPTSASIFSFGTVLVRTVWTGGRPMPLTLMPRSATSLLITRVSCSTALLLAE